MPSEKSERKWEEEKRPRGGGGGITEELSNYRALKIFIKCEVI